MPFRGHHDLRHRNDVVVRNSIMEKVAHGIDENHFWYAPAQRFHKFLWHEPQIEPLLVWVALNSPEAFRKCLRVAMFTTGTDFRAAANRIPGGICPFNSCACR